MLSDLRVKPCPRRSMADHIFSALRKAIFEGRLSEGTHLNQNEIKERFSTSQTPVREALLKLASQNLVDINPNKSATVTSAPSASEMVDLYWMRALIEARALEQFIASASLDEKESLGKYITAMKEAIEGDDVFSFVESDLSLHDAIYAGADLGALYKLWEVIATNIKLSMAQSARTLPDSYLKGAVESHEKLCKAIIDGETEEAVILNEKHLFESAFELRPEFRESFSRRHTLFKQCLSTAEDMLESSSGSGLYSNKSYSQEGSRAKKMEVLWK